MLIIFPPIAFIFLFLSFRQNESWRSAILSAAVTWGVVVTALTEILSLFRAIAFNQVLAGWLVTDIVLIFLYFRVIKKRQPLAPLTFAMCIAFLDFLQ